jgi:methionyl-tRNA synthetase
VLGVLHAALTTIAALIYPVLPYSSATINAALGSAATAIPTWPSAAWPSAAAAQAHRSAPLFPRLDGAAQDAIVAALVAPSMLATASPQAPAPSTAPVAPASPPPAHVAAVSFEDFARIELRVGKVIAAAAVPKAKKLLQLSVDLGEPVARTIVAGIAEAYSADALIGKKVIVVANLAPATIRGIRSEGMILAAGDDAILALSGVDADVAPGTRVR